MADEDKDKKPVTVQKLEPQPVAPSSVSVQANAAQKPYDGMPAMARPKDNPTLIPVNVASKPALKPDEDPGVKSLGNQIKMLHEMANRYTPEDEATRRRRERAENARRITANVGDGLAALANLVGATKGAPVVQSATMASKVEQRLAELRQEREANEQKFMNYSLKENELINQRASTVRQLEADKAAKDRQDWQDDMLRKKFEMEKAQWPYELQIKIAEAEAAGSTAVIKALNASNLSEEQKLKALKLWSEINKNNRSGSGTKQDSQRKYEYNADGKVTSITVTHGNNSGSQENDQNNGNNNGGKSDNSGQQNGQSNGQQKPGLTGKPLSGKSVASAKI